MLYCLLMNDIVDNVWSTFSLQFQTFNIGLVIYVYVYVYGSWYGSITHFMPLLISLHLLPYLHTYTYLHHPIIICYSTPRPYPTLLPPFPTLLPPQSIYTTTTIYNVATTLSTSPMQSHSPSNSHSNPLPVEGEMPTEVVEAAEG